MKKEAALRNSLNHTVLKLHDEQIYQILYTSSICNVYKFDLQDQQWNKVECQGTLFFYKRQDSKFGLMVLNRLNLENLACYYQKKYRSSYKIRL